MATHSSVLAWRIPGMGEPGGLPSLGSHKVGHDWSNFAAAAAGTHYLAYKIFLVSCMIVYSLKSSLLICWDYWSTQKKRSPAPAPSLKSTWISALTLSLALVEYEGIDLRTCLCFLLVSSFTVYFICLLDRSQGEQMLLLSSPNKQTKPSLNYTYYSTYRHITHLLFKQNVWWGCLYWLSPVSFYFLLNSQQSDFHPCHFIECQGHG